MIPTLHFTRLALLIVLAVLVAYRVQLMALERGVEIGKEVERRLWMESLDEVRATIENRAELRRR